MALEMIQWDEWRGPCSNERQIANPMWEEVKATIEALDADKRTIVSLVASDGRQLLIGGGAGQFVMVAEIDDDAHLTARDDSKPGARTELTVGGQTGIYAAQTVWDLGSVLACARLFWQDNTLHPLAAWT